MTELNLTAPQIIDIILLIIVLVTAVKAFTDGFFTAVLNLVGSVASLVAAWFVSKQYSSVVFDSLFRTTTVNATYEYIQDSARLMDIQALLDKFAGGLPASFMQEFAAKAEAMVAELTQPSMSAAEQLVDAIIAPLMTAVIAVVIFAVVFIVCYIVVKLLAKLLKGVNEVPVIGFANRVAGFGVGLATGAINVILISCLLSIIAIVTQNSIEFLNMEVLSQSQILTLTKGINPFMG